MESYKEILEQQKRYFASGATRPISFRIEQLKKLKSHLLKNEAAIATALYKDLHKAPTEVFLSEFVLLIEEIDFIIKHLKKWARPQKVPTPFPIMWPGRSEIHAEPYGTVLIISPWNYPLLLLLSPLIGAISAGNCVVLKPSEFAEHTQNFLITFIQEIFSSEYVAIVTANADTMPQLLQEKYDYIFFTGSTKVGKLIMQAAAQHLTPTTLELGGKSPCIVDASANLDFAARRIAWGKSLNAGQTCIAPDYLFVERRCKDIFVAKLKQKLTQFFSANPETSQGYGRIINQQHFARLTRLLQTGHILYGGKVDESTRFIPPTLIDNVTWNDPIMQEEIFGPILPILTFEHIDEVITAVRSQPKPLALYLFTSNKEREKKILQNLSFGGGCINDCLMNIANPNLPFGGIGPSGMGHYHGKFSFDTFSHRKAVFKKTFLVDISLSYAPYTRRKLWLAKRLFGF